MDALATRTLVPGGSMTEMSRFEKWFVNRRGVRPFERLLARLRGDVRFSLPERARVLELGAGNGSFAKLLYETYHPLEVHVTDYDSAQVELARATLARAYPQLPSAFVVERADATRLPYPDASFDLVVAHMMLHHLGDAAAIEQGMREIFRVLRPGGRLLYVEAFHKDLVRSALLRSGLALSYQDSRGFRRWAFHFAEIGIAVRAA